MALPGRPMLAVSLSVPHCSLMTFRAGPKALRYRSMGLSSAWLRLSCMSPCTALAISSSTLCHGSGVGLCTRGRQTRKMEVRAAALSLMCIEDSASVLTGQVRVMLKPALISATVRASHAVVDLWVNMTVIMPSGLMTLRHSANICAIFDS